jgi:DNA-binding NtrC family response regulator
MSDKLRILIVDDDCRMAKILKDIITVKGYETDVAHSGPEALEKVEGSHFDCVLTDIKMPEMNGVDLYKVIRKAQPDIPVVLMTAYSADKLVEDGLEQGAIAALTKPLDIETLLNFFSMLRKERSIVIVDDDPNFCETLGDILQARGFTVIQITDPCDVVGKIRENIHVLLLDMKLNGINGLDLLKEIRKHYPHLPVILVTGYWEEMGSVVEKAMNINAYTCLYKPLQIDRLIQVLREVHHQELGRVLGRAVRIRR